MQLSRSRTILGFFPKGFMSQLSGKTMSCLKNQQAITESKTNSNT